MTAPLPPPGCCIIRISDLPNLIAEGPVGKSAPGLEGRCAVPDPDSALSDKLPEISGAHLRLCVPDSPKRISGAEPILVESSLQSARPGDRFLRRQAGDRPLTADSSLRMVKCRDKWIVVGDSGGLLLERDTSSWRVVLNLSTGRLELLNASEIVYTTCTAEMVG
jgi:hypothetical protein